jgi:hypothetical protein
MPKPTVATVKQQVEDHVDACADRYLLIEKRLNRIEMIMIGASVSTIGLLIKLLIG